MQGGSQNPITMFQLKIDVGADYLLGKNQTKPTNSEDKAKIKFHSK